MKVKDFLHKLNIGRSTIGHVVLKNVETEVVGQLEKWHLLKEDYLDWGDTKINSFTISDNEILLYVKR